MKSKKPTKYYVLLLTALLLSVVSNPITAAVDPTQGWTQTSYNYNIQTPWDLSQSDRYSYSNGEHRFWIYPDDNCQYEGCGTGPRSELRMQNNYLTGRHQFEGEVYITSGTHGTDIMQVFGGVSYSTSFMMKVTNSNGGTLKRYDNETLMTNAYGKWIKVNVQHDAINGIGKIYVYLDNNLVGIFDDRGYKTHYFKCGVYNINGSKSETRWRNVKYWKDGPVGQTESPVTLYQHCSYGGYSAGFGVGNYTMSDLEDNGITNDDISSLEIASGYSVTLYQHSNFSGNSLTLTADNSCLIDEGFNDDISSMKVTANNLRTGEEEEARNMKKEDEFTLFSNPTIAGDEVNIRYALKESTRIKITIVNSGGQEVATLVDNHQPIGSHSATWKTSGYAKGVYIARIFYGDKSKNMKLVLE